MDDWMVAQVVIEKADELHAQKMEAHAKLTAYYFGKLFSKKG